MKKIVVANWKMNPDTVSVAKNNYNSIKRNTKKYRKVETVIAPPFVFLNSFSGGLKMAAQDVFWQKSGSFTGEVSVNQLAHLKVSYCIVGHSERRELGESDIDVNMKVRALISVGITPIICVGEKDRDSNGEYLSIIKNQIKDALVSIKQKDLSKIIIAYEPIWAIGKKDSIGTRSLHEMSIYIKKVLSDLYSKRTAFKVSVLYGGSVDESNARELVKEGEVQGLLIGRASLEPKKFTEIIKEVNSIK
ncbi:MAG: triose-phosphate isomerase [Candidatus Pacebacteria bacterium]|nr:triose-phosphate isomerase [Candidatus Paceibacterota bacterium]